MRNLKWGVWCHDGTVEIVQLAKTRLQNDTLFLGKLGNRSPNRDPELGREDSLFLRKTQNESAH
jgi:hypothetical protein